MSIYAQNEIFPCTAKRFSTGFAWRALGPFFPFSPLFPARARGDDDNDDGEKSGRRKQAAAANSSKQQQTAGTARID